ncbi:MAG: hypothetical protein ABSG43_31415 [Solirubrobacteraceae bacterium]
MQKHRPRVPTASAAVGDPHSHRPINHPNTTVILTIILTISISIIGDHDRHTRSRRMCTANRPLLTVSQRDVANRPHHANANVNVNVNVNDLRRVARRVRVGVCSVGLDQLEALNLTRGSTSQAPRDRCLRNAERRRDLGTRDTLI